MTAAWTAESGLHALGLHVPADVSVVGFDDIELAPYVEPPLTTVRQDITRMGDWAVATLLDLIAEGVSGGTTTAVEEEAPTQRIPVELIVRSSAGPARSAR